MSHDPNDPLAPFRRKEPRPAASETEQKPLTESQALKLAELASRMYDTLLLCEDALSDLGRMDDGTPSIQALMNIRGIKEEAGYPLPGSDLASRQQMIDARIKAVVVSELPGDNPQLKAINAELLGALQAIQARIDGEFDHPALVEYGPLGKLDDNIKTIASSAITKAQMLEQGPAREIAAPGSEQETTPTETQHTPGEWRVHNGMYISTNEKLYAVVGNHGLPVAFANEANAHLIARAPQLLSENDQLKASNAELLGALKHVLPHVGVGYSAIQRYDILEKARAAIANAPQVQPSGRELSAPEPARDRDIEPDI